MGDDREEAIEQVRSTGLLTYRLDSTLMGQGRVPEPTFEIYIDRDTETSKLRIMNQGNLTGDRKACMIGTTKPDLLIQGNFWFSARGGINEIYGACVK